MGDGDLGEQVERCLQLSRCLSERFRLARDLCLHDLASCLCRADSGLRPVACRPVDGEDDDGRLAQPGHDVGVVSALFAAELAHEPIPLVHELARVDGEQLLAFLRE